ncbi:hypothetical protein, partial [uncultured Helicobacter sp.]
GRLIARDMECFMDYHFIEAKIYKKTRRGRGRQRNNELKALHKKRKEPSVNKCVVKCTSCKCNI